MKKILTKREGKNLDLWAILQYLQYLPCYCILQYFTVFYSILQYFTVFYIILQYFTIFYSILQYFTVFYSIYIIYSMYIIYSILHYDTGAKLTLVQKVLLQYFVHNWYNIERHTIKGKNSLTRTNWQDQNRSDRQKQKTGGLPWTKNRHHYRWDKMHLSVT